MRHKIVRDETGKIAAIEASPAPTVEDWIAETLRTNQFLLLIRQPNDLDEAEEAILDDSAMALRQYNREVRENARRNHLANS